MRTYSPFLLLAFEFEFSGSGSTVPEDYAITVNFEQGCSVVFEPPMGDFDVMQGAFSCDKPITELTMIWNGGQDVIVQAFDGDANDDFLGEMAVTQGMPVTFNGFTSRPNNKTWVVYNANRVKLGESVFHVSCSDDDMDGPEDCGLPQGDGKENDPARINDWLLEGMLGSTSRLTCTPGDDGTAPQSSDPNATTSGGSMIAGLIEVEGMSLFGGSIWLEDVAAGDGGVNGPTVTITWKTNERATSVIIYGKKKDQLTNIITDLELDTFHSLTIPGLTPGKNYHWAIVGDDYDGNLTEPGEVTLCHSGKKTMVVDLNKGLGHLTHGDPQGACPAEP